MINLIKKGKVYNGPFPYFYETKSSVGGEHYETVDLGKISHIINIVAWGVKLYDQNYLTVDGSNNGTSWTRIGRAQGHGNNAYRYTVVRADNVNYRYVRLMYNPIAGTECTAGIMFSYE